MEEKEKNKEKVPKEKNPKEKNSKEEKQEKKGKNEKKKNEKKEEKKKKEEGEKNPKIKNKKRDKKKEEKEKLAKFRHQISETDLKILELLKERMKICQNIGKLKKENNMEIFKPTVESQKLLSWPEKFQPILREIISICRASQKKIKVNYLGPVGSFTHEAATKFFGKDVDFIPKKTITQCLEAIEDYAIVPFENSIEGTIHETLDFLSNSSDHHIIAMAIMEIKLYMLYDGDLSKITQIYSNKVAIKEAKEYLKDINKEIIYVNSTSEGAKIAKERNQAAIASQICGKLFSFEHMDPIKVSGNYTKFAIIGKNPPEEVKGKTLICFTLPNKPGALLKVLKEFKTINLTKIESRPLGHWDYKFFLEYEGSPRDLPQIDVCSLRILGNYLERKI